MGGSVVATPCAGVDNLRHVPPTCNGVPGTHGTGRSRRGRNGPEMRVLVPLGTVVRDPSTGDLLADLVYEGERFIMAHGGRGGRGNASFVDSTHQRPHEAEKGEPGEERRLTLELKTIADVGLVGYPNAGKSTLLSAISRARPKIASYPFTTLTPKVGVVKFPDSFRFTVADIPGLVDGAHDNRGLGHTFLRHIERTNTLVYVLDIAGTEGRDPLSDLESLQNELRLYHEGFLWRPSLVVANKMDLAGSAQKNFVRVRDHAKLPVFSISAKQRTGMDPVLQALRELLESSKDVHTSDL